MQDVNTKLKQLIVCQQGQFSREGQRSWRNERSKMNVHQAQCEGYYHWSWVTQLARKRYSRELWQAPRKKFANGKPGADRAGPHNSCEDQSTCDRARAIEALLQYAEALDLAELRPTKEDSAFSQKYTPQTQNKRSYKRTTPLPAREAAASH